VPAETLALSQSVQTVLLWSDRAFTGTSPLALVNGQAMLRVVGQFEITEARLP
jgi:hypothetical protein